MAPRRLRGFSSWHLSYCEALDVLCSNGALQTRSVADQCVLSLTVKLSMAHGVQPSPISLADAMAPATTGAMKDTCHRQLLQTYGALVAQAEAGGRRGGRGWWPSRQVDLPRTCPISAGAIGFGDRRGVPARGRP